MTDKELTDLLKSNPQNGLAAVVGQYSAYVYKIVSIKLNTVCTIEDMEEAVSDVFLLFYRSGKRCGFDMRSIKSYLAVIARRHCANLYNRRFTNSDDISFDEIADMLGEERDNALESVLCDAIKSLGSTDEEIFIRRYFFGQPVKDIAHELHMKPNTVDKRISRGLIKLKKILEKM